jgi:hypothetical protein
MDAYSNALKGRDSLRQVNGLYYNLSNSWSALGPKPGEFVGTISGRGQVVAIDPLRGPEGMTVYYASADGGLYKSTNAFATSQQEVIWTEISSTDMSSSSGSIALYQNPGQSYPIIYYGTGEAMDYGSNYLGNGIYKTENDGFTWTKGTGLPKATKVFKIAIDPNNPNHLFAALGDQWANYGETDCGLYVSYDAGLNWSRIKRTANLQVSDVQFDPSNGNRVYAIGPPPDGPPKPDGIPGIGYLISTDGGYDWFVPFINGLTLSGNPVITICSSSPNVIYILSGYSSNGSTTIYRSSDDGLHFDSVHGNSGLYLYPAFNHIISVSPTDPNFLFVSGKAIYRSYDGGQNFTEFNGQMHDDIHGFAFYPTTDIGNQFVNRMVITGDGGVYRTFNGAATYPIFESLNYSLGNLQFYRAGCDPYKLTNMLGASEDNGLQHRTSSSLHWVWRTGGDYANVCFNSKKPGNLIHMGCNNTGGDFKLYASFDGGYSKQESNFVSNQYDPVNWIMPMVYDANVNQSSGYGSFYTANKVVKKSTDGGLNFVSISGVLDYYNKPVCVLGVSQSNPDYIYAALYIFPTWPPVFSEHMYMTSDGGASWNELYILSNGLPNKYITDIQVDPVLNNEVYVTVSGFWTTGIQGEHVYKSTNFGSTWSPITGLTIAPANDILINYKDCNTRQFFTATDVGVYVHDDGVDGWYQLGNGLPNVPCKNLEINKFSQLLRVGTTGRGVWEYDLGNLSQDPKIYVKDHLYLNSYSEGLNIDYDIVVCDGGSIIIPEACTLKFAQDKKIIVQDGGSIDASSNNAITLTSQSGQWGGIEFQGSGYGTINNCTISNAPVAVNIDGTGGSGSSNNITIDGCTIHFGGIYINSRDNVYIQNSIINAPQDPTYTGISINYGNNINIYNNTINGAQIGISIDNSNPYVANNNISGQSQSPLIGISMNNAYCPTLNNNTITNFITGFDMINSSPTMYQNTSINDQTGLTMTALHAISLSSPRLKPSEDVEGNRIWDAGQNILKVINSGNGISIQERSVPDIDVGYNTIYGATTVFPPPPPPPPPSVIYNHITGNIGDPLITEYYATYNCWVVTPQNDQFTLDVPVDFDSYDCSPPGGGGSGNDKDKVTLNDITSGDDPLTYAELPSEAMQPPPTPIIINHGNGIIDTIKISNTSHTPSADRLIYSQAVKQELLGNYNNALALYLQVISNYKDSITAVYSLRNILICHDKLHSDTTAYGNLRTYYHNLAQSSLNDSTFFMVANELATKSLVRKTQFPEAITEYENVIANNRDTLIILSLELNIIETYMLIYNRGGGNAPQFTGKLAYLKPVSKLDGFKMIREKIRKIAKLKENKIIPQEFKISQNYPNPFNPTTKIEYSLPQNTKVKIKIYDILGRMVKVLVDEFKEAGIYTVQFDGSNYASGVYFYRIEAGKFVNTKKMVLVK